MMTLDKTLNILAFVAVLAAMSIVGFVSVQAQAPNASQNSIQSNDANDPNQICLKYFTKFTPNHTACEKPNTSCKIKIRGLYQNEQGLIIDEHNRWRNHLASGNESHRGFPSSSDMLRFEWDSELAYVAQKHAEQCAFEHDCYDCRKTTSYSVVGQNLYIYRTTRLSAKPQWETVIKEWYDEIKIAPADVWKSFDLHGLNIGHFTQIAWSKTNRVGCGYTSYDNTNPESEEDAIFKTIQLYTCNYAPGGNYINEPLYASGSAASNCPVGSKPSSVYPALCEYPNSSRTTTTRTKKKKTKKNKKKTIKRKKITVTHRLRTSFRNGTDLTNTTITRTILSPASSSVNSSSFWLSSFTRSSVNENRATSLTRNAVSPFNKRQNRNQQKRKNITTPWWRSYATTVKPQWKYKNNPNDKKANRTARSYVSFEMSYNGTTTQRYRNLL